MNPESFWSRVNWERIAFLTLASFFFLNLFILDVWVATKRGESVTSPQIIEETQEEPSVAPALQPTETDLCPQPCLEAISEATATDLASTPTPMASTPEAAAKEFFISFGGGSTRAGDWEDMFGLEAYIDSSKYTNVKEMVFEAGMSIPNGNQIAYVRLYNVTDGHAVWNSEMWLEGGTPKLLVSSPITLAPGKKLYRVQMKTQVRDLAILSQARIRITTN